MRAGYGQAELTPPMGVELAGYGYYLQRRAKEVMDPLFARAMMLEAEGERALVISCELLGLSRAVCDEVIRHAQTLGLEPEGVMMVSVHTHTGPCIKYHEGCGMVDPAYVATVAGKICAAVDAAYADMAEVTVLSHTTQLVEGDHIYNRADPDGPVDHMVRGFILERADSKPIAAVSAACHGVFNGRIPAVSADFAGEINRMMEEKGYHSLYLNGLCGDIDPWKPTPARRTEYARRVTERFLAKHEPLPLTLKIAQVPFTLRLVSVTMEDVNGAADAAVARAGGEDVPAAVVARTWQKEMLAKLDTLRDTEDIVVKVLVLGGVPVTAFPFEGFTLIGNVVRKCIGWEDALTLGCAEELLGYLPTKDDIQRGAYAALESTFLYKRLPVVPGEAERLAEETGAALERILA